MANLSPLYDAAFFTDADPVETLGVEIQKLDGRLKSLRTMQQWAKIFTSSLHETPSLSALRTRSARLGSAANLSKNPNFIIELKKLTVKQLAFLAKGYNTTYIGVDFRAECLQAFMENHNASVDETVSAAVEAGARRTGGEFWTLFQNAKATTATPSLTTATSGSPMKAVYIADKHLLARWLHHDVVGLIGEAGTGTYVHKVAVLVYQNALELRIDVPRGVDARQFKVLPENKKWGDVDFETKDVIVVRTFDQGVVNSLLVKTAE